MKILLAVDGSDHTQKMLDYITTHSELFGGVGEYLVLTVQPSIPPRVRSVVGQAAVNSYATEEAELVLAPVAEFLLRHGINAKTSWKMGPPGETIAKFAETEKCDLVVMGSHGHGALAKLVMGSVATQVLAHCHVPVLLVR
ncbi:universal stress protein [Rhodoferax sp. WC2427]|uniref:universal stress protein n=1 Tax=Rhodoferax sp. WC2427 TaxID=3234144 RepID=UPI003467DF98